MNLTEYATRLAGVGATLHRWLALAKRLDSAKRERAALYSEEIAATLARASAALALLDLTPQSPSAVLAATRELGRISGYIETIVMAFAHHLDGRRRAGVKRRLEMLEPFDVESAIAAPGALRQARRLTSAEGYFRALADALRA